MNNLKDIHNPQRTMLVVDSVVLSGFQWTIWRIYTTKRSPPMFTCMLFYQDFNEQFEGYTQLVLLLFHVPPCCFIRISMNNLLQKYRKNGKYANLHEIILIFQKKALPLHQQIWRIYTIRIIPLCKHSEWHASVALFFSQVSTLCTNLQRNYLQATAPQMYHPNKTPISLKQFAMQQQSSSAVFPQ